MSVVNGFGISVLWAITDTLAKIGAIRIFAFGLDTFARCEKFPSKLDIYSLAYSYLCLRLRYFLGLQAALLWGR